MNRCIKYISLTYLYLQDELHFSLTYFYFNEKYKIQSKMHIVHDDAYYESRIPQPDLGPLKNFLRFVWDSKTKTLLGRTAKEWSKHLNIFLM